MSTRETDIERERQRLAELERELEEARRRLAELTGEVDEGPRFIDPGTLGGPVDNTIAPPG